MVCFERQNHAMLFKVSFLTIILERNKLKSKYQKQKHIFLNSARSFVNNCPHFQTIMYNEFQQSYNNKDNRIKLLIQFVTMLGLNWYSQTEL